MERLKIKGPSAVLVMRKQGKVLGLTRGLDDIAGLHLIGGKWDRADGFTNTLGPKDHCTAVGREDREFVDDRVPNTRVTAARECAEESGIRINPVVLEYVGSFVARTMRPVDVFTCVAPDYAPARPMPTQAGIPGWVVPEAMTASWCPFSLECRVALALAGVKGSVRVTRAMLAVAHMRDEWRLRRS